MAFNGGLARYGYNNIPIKESDRDKTAFVTRRGCFRYKVLPWLDLCTFRVQRRMDLVLCGLTYETYLVFLDEIVVYSHDFDSHIERLCEVCQKCHFEIAHVKVFSLSRKVSFWPTLYRNQG